MRRAYARSQNGFTLLEVVLIVAALAVAAGVFVVVANPGKRLAETRNGQRESDVTRILNAVHRYRAVHGAFPPGLPGEETEICTTGAEMCDGYVDLSLLTKDQAFLEELPTDPTAATVNGTGYTIVVVGENITVFAPAAENQEVISLSR